MRASEIAGTDSRPETMLDKHNNHVNPSGTMRHKVTPKEAARDRARASTIVFVVTLPDKLFHELSMVTAIGYRYRNNCLVNQ